MDAPNRTVARAKSLRRRMTLPEVLLWSELRQHKLDGFLFRRQHPVGPYVLDFYCDEGKLAVEVDGAVHANFESRVRHDEDRDAWLEGRGIQVLRLTAKYVLSEMDGVLRMIRAALPDVAPTPRSRSAQGRPT